MKSFILLLTITLSSAGYSQMLDEERYVMMIEFLSKNGGRWEHQRINFDKENAASANGDGLYCYFDESKNFLRFRKVSHFRNSDFVDYERTWYWNASEKAIQFISWENKGNIQKGEVQVVSEKAFVLTYERITSEGNVIKGKEENVITGEREFETKVFELVEDDWVELEVFKWKR